jgi:type I restriction enzyme M protein
VWRGEVIADPDLTAKRLRSLLAEVGVKGKPLQTAVLDALAVRNPDAEPVTDVKGRPLPDPDLRDNENVPLPAIPVTYEAGVGARLRTVEYRAAVDDYLAAEIYPYVPDAWVDHDKTRIGYEVPLTRHFYRYTPPRPLAEIDAEIKQLEAEIQELLSEVTE